MDVYAGVEGLRVRAHGSESHPESSRGGFRLFSGQGVDRRELDMVNYRAS